MGIGISAYNNVAKSDYVLPEDEEDLPDGLVRITVRQEWPKQGAGLVNKGIYSYESKTDTRIGSYGGYLHWRNTVAQMAGYGIVDESYPHQAAACHAAEGPFQELLAFSDCEGTINTEVCTKLLNDFRQYRPQIDTIAPTSLHPDEVALFKEFYDSIMGLLEHASNNGFITFS